MRSARIVLEHVGRASVAVVVACLMTLPSSAQTPEAPRISRDVASGVDLVVRFAKGELRGAGIVVGAKDGTIYIATARHVITDFGDSTHIPLSFHFDPKKEVIGRVVRKHPGDTLDVMTDIALVAVSINDVPKWSDAQLEFDRLGDASRLKPGELVMSIGCPADGCWHVPVEERVFNTGKQVIFLTQFVRPGDSGGALLNEWGEITAMVIRQDPPTAYAIASDVVMREVKSWGAEVSLHGSRFPRAGYHSDVGASVLFSSNSHSDRLPSGRFILTGSASQHIGWHVGLLRLAPDSVAISSAVAGLSLAFHADRLTFRPFAEAGMARTEVQHDLGGYWVSTSSGDVYRPVSASTLSFSFGGGAGASCNLLLFPHLSLDLTAATWGFQLPAGAPETPKVYFGAGLRWAIR
jgi:trypsin-like peptidase